MSTETGVPKVVDEAIRKHRADIERDAAANRQADLLDPLDPEDLLDAREQLGPNASNLSVVREARKARSGRPKNARNRRTDDLVRYLSQFGPDPAIAAMKIIATTEELMVERSKSVGDGKRRMTFAEAQAHRERMIELMMPYWHGKKPVAVDLTFSGVSDLVIEGLTHTTAEVHDIVEADFLPVDGDDADGEGEA